jgi:hypothetical protein
MRSYLRAAALILVAAAIAVVADPTHRATTLRVALLALATLVAIGLVQGAARRTPPGAPSPFDRTPAKASEAVVPADLARLAGDVERYRHPDRSRLATGTLDRTVRDVVRQRLRHHHGVTAGEDVLADPAARALLGPATTAVLGRRGAGTSEALEPGRLVAELEEL